MLIGLLSSQIGVSAYMHYCDGELAHLALEQPDTEPCGCDGNDDGCCKDIIVKAKLDQQLFSSDATNLYKSVKLQNKFISDYFIINKPSVFASSDNLHLYQKFRWLPPGSIELVIHSVFLRL